MLYSFPYNGITGSRKEMTVMHLPRYSKYILIVAVVVSLCTKAPGQEVKALFDAGVNYKDPA